MQNQASTYSADFQGNSSQNPTSAFYADSFSDVLMRSIGYYVTCEFLIGTGGLEQKSGYLYAAGVNFLTLHDVAQNRYTVCDLYSVKFVTVYADQMIDTPAAPTPPPTPTPRTSNSYQPPQQSRRSSMGTR